MNGKVILVVEDNPITRKMIVYTLASEGYTVLEASDGRAALALDGRPPDLMLLDFVLPDMDGLQLLARLRARPGGADVPAAIITGMVSHLAEMSSKDLGPTSFLPKPIEPERLIEFARGHLAGQDPTIGGGRRVLVVDDDPTGRKLAALSLEEAGFEVETAESGAEALEKARRTPPDAILSDVLMPGMDGFQLSRAVRRDPQLGRIPVVLTSSAYVDAPDEALAHGVGASGLVPRGPDFGPAILALTDALSAGVSPRWALLPEPSAAHADRVRVQLEKQVARNDALLRQGAIQAAALSVVRGLAEALARPSEMANMLADILVHCLDAAGLSSGVLYLPGPEGRLRLQSQSGLDSATREDAATVFGHPEIVERALASGQPLACTRGRPEPAPELLDFMNRIGRASVLIVPFVVQKLHLGALILASDNQDLSNSSWVGFAGALGVQFGQTIALGQHLARGAATELRYQALVEGADDAIVTLDSTLHIVQANRAASALFGRERDDLVGRRYPDLIAPEEREQAAHKHDVLLAQRVARTHDRQVLRPDGTRVVVDTSFSLVKFGEEDITIAVLRDVTERKRAAEENRLLAERLASTLENITEAFFTMDRDLRFTYLNPQAERLLQRSRGDLLGRVVWAEFPEARGTVFQREYERALADGVPVEFEELYAPLGVWLEVRAYPSGEGLAVYCHDVSERRRAREALRESEERYRRLFDGSPHPMWVYDPQTLGFLEVNDAAVRLYGYSRDEFLRMTITDIHPPEEVPRLLERLAAGPDEPTATDDGVRCHRRKDGSLLEVEVAANTILHRGKPAHLVLGTDVSEKQRLELQLRQSQKMEAVGQLAGGVAHDFNNLLGVITGHTELLRKDLGPENRDASRLEQIARAADRAAGLTRQLLAFSRKQVLQPRILDLNAVVGDTQAMLRRLIGEHIQFVSVLGCPLGRVRLDRGQVEQVIVNLVVNARDAMPTGGRLVIETSNATLGGSDTRNRHVAPGDYVLLTVSDTGHGIDPALTARIFEPFFTTKEPGKGTGLGLATVDGIVHQSGGHIVVHSEPGRGTTFKVYFPIEEGSLEPSFAAAPLAPPPRGTETVLLIEDAEALRLIVRELLEDAGYRVIDGTTTDEALALAARHDGPIHVVLTDVVMPGASGPEVAARLKALRPEIRVLLMSGYSGDVIGPQGLLDSGTRFIQKPFTADELQRTLREVLDAPDE